MIVQAVRLVFILSTSFIPVFAFRSSLKLISDPVDGLAPASDSFKTIMDPPSSLLSEEYNMVIPIDDELDNVLLEIGNDLGWNFHFGCVGDKPREALSLALLCAPGQIVLKEAGLMFFTFRGHGPMRVKVYRSNVPFDPHAGNYFYFDEVPYDKMWSDDRIWMPTVLENKNSYFEAHFVFDGPPGSQTPLLKHSYQVFDDLNNEL